MAIYEQLEQKRIELYEKYKKNKTIGIVLMIIGILFFFLFPIISMMSTSNPPSIVFGLAPVGMALIVVGGILTSIAAKYNKTFNQIVKSEFAEKFINEHLEKAWYNEHGTVSVSKINSVGLVKSPDRFAGEDLITGVYKDITYQVSDVVLTERQVTHTKNGTHVTYVDYFKGRWYVYSFPKNFNKTLKIVESRAWTNTRGLKKIESEMIDFNKKFSIFASDDHIFFYLINPYLLERLLLLEQAHKGTIYYCFKDNELHIGVNDNSDSLSMNIKNPINKESLETFIEDVVLIERIIEEFRLYDAKFQKD